MITVEKQGAVYVLRSDGEPCGPRLRKSEPWPLRSVRPFDYDTHAEATIAVGELAAYLAKHLVRK